MKSNKLVRQIILLAPLMLTSLGCLATPSDDEASSDAAEEGVVESEALLSGTCDSSDPATAWCNG